jgi:hypothetical protein
VECAWVHPLAAIKFARASQSSKTKNFFKSINRRAIIFREVLSLPGMGSAIVHVTLRDRETIELERASW